jgi:AbrB family looped-hinge helix DNA binding protein
VIATLSSREQTVIPQAVRERCGLGEGDHFVIEDDPEAQVVTLRKVKAPGRWFEVYMQCPHSFSVPKRRQHFHRPRHELAG